VTVVEVENDGDGMDNGDDGGEKEDSGGSTSIVVMLLSVLDIIDAGEDGVNSIGVICASAGICSGFS
jgi:hypothetical protein